VSAINEVNAHADTAQSTANNANSKANIVQAQVSNSNDSYDSSKAYAVGDLCIHNNVLYRCITPCSAGSWATNQSCFTQVTLVNVVSDIDNSINAVDVISEINISNYISPTNTFNIPADGYIQLIADANVNNVTAAYIMPSNIRIANVIVTNKDVAMYNTFFVKKGMEFYFYLSEATYSKVLYYKLG
jgi:hypothetical protein